MKKKTVKVGQIWTDNDARRAKRNLRVRAIGMSKVAKSRLVLVENTKTGKETVVHASRFRPITRGYRLVRDVRR